MITEFTYLPSEFTIFRYKLPRYRKRPYIISIANNFLYVVVLNELNKHGYEWRALDKLIFRARYNPQFVNYLIVFPLNKSLMLSVVLPMHYSALKNSPIVKAKYSCVRRC